MINLNVFHRRTLATTLVAGAAGIATVCLAPGAMTHDVVIGGNPANGEVVEGFPDRIELEFSGIPREEFSTVAITEQANGELLFSGTPELDGRWVSLQLPEDISGGPGDYTIGFSIISSDGHATRGMTTFTVAGDTAQPAEGDGELDEAAPTEAGNGEDTGLSGPLAWITGGLGVIAILGVIVMMIAKGRNTPQE